MVASMRSISFLAACALVAGFAGCGGGSNQSPQTPPPPTSVIAYLHRIGNGLTYEIRVLKTDGTTATVGSSDTYVSVVLSPNGQKVLFSYYDGFDILANYQIATMNVDGTGKTLLTTPTSGGLYPQYTPDGSKIVFESGRQIAVMNADGSNPTVITNLSAGEFCFPATNGTIIAAGMYPLGSQGLTTMNMDGSNQQIIVASAYPLYPSFSADGSRIIFSNSDGRSENIYSVSTNGTGLTALTNSTWNYDPFVAGNKIYFDYIPDSLQNPTVDSNQIYSIGMDGSNLAAVTSDTLYDGFKTFNRLCENP